MLNNNVQVSSPEAAPDAAPAPALAALAAAAAEAETSEVREEAVVAGAEAVHCATPLLDTEVSILY